MAVEIGDEAPDFELPDQHGTPVKLSSFRGAKNVVLVFYPLAFSPVCSGELCALREEFPEVNRDDVELLTVSVDSMFTHRAWADAENFQFSLLADFWPHGAVAKQYGVFDEDRGLAIARHLRHRQGRRRALVGGQPHPAGQGHRRLPEGPLRTGLTASRMSIEEISSRLVLRKGARKSPLRAPFSIFPSHTAQRVIREPP